MSTKISPSLLNVGMKHFSTFSKKADKMNIKADKYVPHVMREGSKAAKTTIAQGQFVKAANF